jgi:hypothetical protein
MKIVSDMKLARIVMFLTLCLGFHVKVNLTRMNFYTHNFCTILSRFHFPNCLLALMKSILKVKDDNLKFLDFSHWCS